jgi:hypothetical protein
MPETFKQSLVDLLEPMFYADLQNNNSLNIYLSGLSDPLFQDVEDWASDTDDGKPGYSILIDITRTPDEALPWLAQFVGAKLTVGLSPDQQRQQIIGLGNWKRGTVAALQAAPLQYLTGTQTVVVHERDTSPYHFLVYTLASETPNSAAVLAALLANKPAGLQMTYTVYSGQHAWTVRGSTMRGADVLRFSL